jgi:cupin 2 domain-containing protein
VTGRGSLLAGIPAELPVEILEVLVQREGVRVERIVSRGHASPPGFWYDQDEGEWVVVVAGAAEVRFEGQGATVRMGPGDWLDIPAHVRHRVEWTDPERDTVWLSVRYK